MPIGNADGTLVTMNYQGALADIMAKNKILMTSLDSSEPPRTSLNGLP